MPGPTPAMMAMGAVDEEGMLDRWAVRWRRRVVGWAIWRARGEVLVKRRVGRGINLD